jgi:3-oxoacyl-[acyl-carrier-protein] synthase-3
MRQNKAAIKEISTHLPLNKLTNEQLALDYPDWNVEKIYEKTGVSVRSISADNECASDLGVAAAKKLFESGICKPTDIQFLLLCTQVPDYYLPATACTLQERLGLKTSCGALDYNLGCSGYVYGLSLAKGLIEAGLVENVLLINAETVTKYINPTDRSVRTIVGDGAAATFISSIETTDDLIGPFVFGTYGKGAKDLIIPAGGQRLPITAETAIEKEVEKGVFRSEQNLYMNGAEIFNFSLKVVPKTINELLLKSGMLLADVDYFVFHQANRFILEHLRDKIKIPKDKFCINLESYGNTASATIPMALEIARNQGKIRNGDTVMLVGFGVGLSWAATLVKLI